MKKILILFVTINFFNQIFSIDYKNSNFDIKYIGTISSDGNWGYYTANNKSGPYFVDKNNCLYIDDSNQLILYSLETKEKKVIEKTNGDLNKIGNSIYLKKNNDYYLFKDLKLEKVRNEIYLFDSYYYNDTDGIFIKESNKKKILVPNIPNDQFEYYFVKGPIYDGDNLYYLAIDPKYSLSYNLIKYDIKKQKEIILQKVTTFALLNNSKDYILTYAIGGKYTFAMEFAGDFYLINNNKGDILFDFDKSIYEKKSEFTIISFDINKDNKIVAFGSYANMQNKNKPISYDPVIILELIELDNIKQINIKYYSPSVSNLRFRETPDLNGKFIRSLNQNEKLELIEKGKEDTINGTKGTWVKVKTEKGEVGWCFDAYLEEVKKK